MLVVQYERQEFMILKIDSKSGVPIYLQIMNGIKDSVIFGALMPGDKLPSVRELAIQLRVNPNTVAKSYRELKHEGIIDPQWGGGNFIADDVKKVSGKEKRNIVSGKMKQAVENGRELGFSDKELKDFFTDVLKK